MPAAPHTHAYALHACTRPLPGNGSRIVLRLYFATVGALGAIVVLWDRCG